MSGYRNNIIMKDDEDRNDSNVESQIKYGLMAAQQYQENRQRLSLSTQEDMLDATFGTRLPEGTTTMPSLTEDEYVQLQSSIRKHANQRRENVIARLRDQLTEYHSLLDQLHTIAAKNKVLQRTVLDRDNRIDALEQELVVLKRKERYQQQHDTMISDRSGGGTRRISIHSSSSLQQPAIFQQPISISIPSSSSAFQYQANNIIPEVTPRYISSSNLFCCSLNNNNNKYSAPEQPTIGDGYYTTSPMMLPSNNQVSSNNHNNNTQVYTDDHDQSPAGHSPTRVEKKRTISDINTDESSSSYDVICMTMSSNNHQPATKRLKKE